MITVAEIGRRLKVAGRYLLSGRPSTYHEDEEIGFSLAEFSPSHDKELQGRRLNIVIPSLSSRSAFGGISTLIDFPMQVFASGLLSSGWRLRFISSSSIPEDNDNLALKNLMRKGISRDVVDFVHAEPGKNSVSVGGGDVFLGSLWFSFFSVLPLLKYQVDVLGVQRMPYISLMQDYEASFNPWSSAYVMAQSMYDWDWPMVHLFNSIELRDFYISQGHVVDASEVFEPIMNAQMRGNLATNPPGPKTRRILFYGRPGARRNCFFLVRAALDEWSLRYPDAASWEVISVGEDYSDFKLKGGHSVKVLGKLSLDEYCEHLREAAVGISLMASPHPSYPPLEMAHFGALTLTNSFPHKNLSSWHENIASVHRCHPTALADALVEACRRFEADPTKGTSGRTLKPSYLLDYDRQKLEKCAMLIARSLN